MAESFTDGVATAQRQIALEQAAALKQENADLKAQDLLNPETAPLPQASPVQQDVDSLKQFQQAQVLPGTDVPVSQGFTDLLESQVPLDPQLGGSPVSDIVQGETDLTAGETPPVPVNVDILDARTVADVGSAIYSGTIGVGNTIVDSFVGGPAEFIAGLDSDETKEIQAKLRQGVELTEDEQAYTRSFDFLTQSASIDAARGGRAVVGTAFQKARDLVETDRLKKAKGNLTQGLADAFDEDNFIPAMGAELVKNPLGTLGVITESLPFMFAAGSKATAIPFSIAFTGENYKAATTVYEEEFGDVPNEMEKGLMLLGSAFIAAMNSKVASTVTGESLVRNIGGKLSQSAVAKYLATASQKLGAKLTNDGSRKMADLLIKASKTSSLAALNLAGKGTLETLQEGSEGLITAATAKQTLDFTPEERKEAAVSGAIGFASGAGIGGTVDLAQFTAEGLVQRQDRVLRERDIQRNGINRTEVLRTAAPNSNLSVDYLTEVDGVAIPVGENYDPLTLAQRGPVDENSIESIRETIGHIKNAVRVAQAVTEDDLDSDEVSDYIAAVVEQGGNLAAYNEQIQELAQRDIKAAEAGPSLSENKQNAAEVLKDVYFGSSAPPINLNLVEQLRSQVDNLSEQLGPVATAAIKASIAAAEAVQTAEEAITSTSVPTDRRGKTQAQVHDEIINGTLNEDGTRKNKGGNIYRARLAAFIETGDVGSFNKEIEQLRAFIKGQRSKLPEGDALREGVTEVHKSAKFLGKFIPVIKNEIEYLQAIEDEAVAARKIAQSRVAAAPGAPVVGAEGVRVTSPAEGVGVATSEAQPQAEQVASPTPTEAPTSDERAASEARAESEAGTARPSEVSQESEDPRPRAVVASEAESAIGIPEEIGLISEETETSQLDVSDSEEIQAISESDVPKDSEATRAVSAPDSNPNLESTIPVVKAVTNKGIDIRPLSATFKSIEDLTKNIFLRTGAFETFETLLATARELQPDMNFNFNSKGWKALKQIHQRYETFLKTQRENNLSVLGKKLGALREDPKVFGSTYANNLALGLTVEVEPGVFQFRPEVIAAISVATALWIREDSYSTLAVDDHALSQWFGVDERDISPEAANELREGGLPRNMIAQDIGNRVFQTLGIKKTDSTSLGAQEKLSQALGLIAVEIMSQRNEIALTSTGAKDLNDQFWGTDRARQPDAAKGLTNNNKVQIVRLKVANNTNPDTGYPQVHTSFFTPGKNNAAGVYKENPEIGSVLFGIETQIRESLTEPKEEVPKTVRGGPTEVTQEQQDAARAAQDIPHYTNATVADKLISLGRPFMKQLLGYIENAETESHIDNIDGHQGVNLEIENAIDALIEHMTPEADGGRGLGDGKTPFFFGINIAKNRRSYYESSKYNPQSKLLHRFTTKLTTESTKIPTDIKNKSFDAFLVAITMGLELTDEKTSLVEHQRLFKEFVESPVMEAISVALRKNDGVALLRLMPEKSAHAFQAIIELNKWFEASRGDAESFETDMTMETDGVTNGAAIGFVQFAHAFSVQDMFKWFQRVGIFRKKDGFTGYQDWKSRGNNDSYQHMATKAAQNLITQRDSEKNPDEKRIQAAVGRLIGDLSDENGVTAEARKLMKNPFMIHNYGASTGKILGAIADELVQKLLDQLESAVQNQDEKALAEVNLIINGITGGAGPVLTMDNAIETSWLKRTANKPALWDMLATNILETIKEPITTALNDELGSFTTVRGMMNDAFQIQFVAFDEAYKAELKTLSSANPDGFPLTEKQARDALNTVKFLLPGFNGAMKNTKPENRIPVLNQRTTLADSDVNTIVQIYLAAENKVGAASAKGLSAKKIFVDGGVSGAILAIHSLDATIQQRTMDIVRKKLSAEVLNIWDAGLTDITTSPEYAKVYNQVFIETVRDYNMLSDVQAMMGATESTPAIEKFIKTLTVIENGKKKQRYANLNDFNGQLQQEINKNNTRKDLVFDQQLVVEQMVHPGEQSQYQYDPAVDKAAPIQFKPQVKPDVTTTDDLRADTQPKADKKEAEAKPERAKEEPVQVDPLAPVPNLLQFVRSKLARFPQELRSMVDEVVVLTADDPRLKGSFARAGLEDDGKIRILISDRINDPTENLNPKNRPWFRGLNRSQMISKIFHHELGHILDAGLYQKFGERPSDPFKNIAIRLEYKNRAKNAAALTKSKVYMSYPFDMISDEEVATQMRELFAELFSWYITDRASMIAEQPDLADYMEKTYASIFRTTNEEPAPTTEEGQPLRGPASPEVLNTAAGRKQAEATDAASSEEVEPSTILKGTKINVTFVKDTENSREVEVRDSFKLFGQTFVVHRPAGSQDGTPSQQRAAGWMVTEITTGFHIGISQPTIAKAKEAAIKALKNAGAERVAGIINKEQTMNEETISITSPFPGKSSSERQINIDTFVADSQQDVTSSNLRTVFDSITGLGAPSQLSQSYRNHLKALLDTVVKKGIEPLDRLILNIKSDQSGSFGAISGENIYINTNSTRETFNEQTAEEVLVHELIHAISGNFIDTNQAGRAKIRRLFEIARKEITYKDFLKLDANGNILFTVSEEAEIAQAKRTYNYVFNTRSSTGRRGDITNNALHEFFTYALTNEQMITKLSQIPTRETKFTKEGSLFEGFLSVLEDIFNFIAKTLDTTDATNIQLELSNIVHNIIAVEQSHIFNVLTAIETGFAAGRKPLDLSVKYLVDQLASLIRAIVPLTGREAMLGFIPNTLRTVANTVLYHQTIEGVADDNPVTAAVKDATGKLVNEFTSESGVLRKTMNSLINRSHEFAPWHKMLRNSKHMIDQLRSTVSSTIAMNVRDRFSVKLSEVESKAVTRAFLQADIDSLRGYSLDQIASFMRSRPILSREIQQKKKDLMRSIPQDKRAWVQQQSAGLAQFMITGTTSVYNQALNVHHILDQLGLTELAPDLDEYISLLALQELPPTGRSVAADVIDREQAANATDNGITYLQAQHKSFKKESLARLFDDNPMFMNKGYMSEVYDQSRDLRVALTADRQMLENEGYILLHALKDDDTSLAREPKSLYMAKSNPRIQRLKSIVSVADKAAFGTTLAASARSEGRGFNRVMDSLQVSRTKHIYNQKESNNSRAPDNTLIPLRNAVGDIVNYRYAMTEDNRAEYLKKDYDIGTVLGAMHASIESKSNSEQINNEAVRMAHTDWLANGEETPEKFIAISRDPESEHFETYKLMPAAMRREVDRLFGRGEPMMIRGELSDLIFGFRKASIANLKVVKDLPFANLVGLLERGWQEIIAQEKVNIVIKTIDVMLNNIISNTIVLKVLGIPMKDILADTKEAVDGMNQYQRDFEELLALEKELAGDPTKRTDPKFLGRVDFLKNELKVNPVAELVDEGIFQSITEDIDADQYGDKTRLIDWLQNTIGKHTPEFVKKGVELAYISENTQAFKFLMKTTQYSDFTARYVMFKHEMAKEGANKEAVLTDIVRTFINYDDPSNKYTQWANDMGLIMFTKFAIGIQNVIVRLAGKKTANLATSILLQEYVMEVSDITDSFLLNGGITHMFHLNPVTHLENAFAPYGIVTATDFLT